MSSNNDEWIYKSPCLPDNPPPKATMFSATVRISPADLISSKIKRTAKIYAWFHHLFHPSAYDFRGFVCNIGCFPCIHLQKAFHQIQPLQIVNSREKAQGIAHIDDLTLVCHRCDTHLSLCDNNLGYYYIGCNTNNEPEEDDSE